jgi:hypothetical protein
MNKPANIIRIFSLLAVFIIGLIPATGQALTVNPIIELEADPGTTINTTLKLFNEERESRTFYIKYENFNSQDETGTPSFLPRLEDLAAWIKTPSTVVLGPGETMEMPLQVAVPANAEPGGHYAAVFFNDKAPLIDGEESNVAIASKLGSLILLRVKGDFAQGGSVLEFGTTGKQRFFSRLPIQFYYRFQNTGDDHQKPIGNIIVKNIFGQNAKILDANAVQGSVLPKSVRKFFSVWLDAGGDVMQKSTVDLPKEEQMSFGQAAKYELTHFKLGYYKADLKIGFGTGEFQSDHANFSFFIIPWHLLVIVIPILLVALILLRFLLKGYNRRIIARAQRR